MQRPRILVFSLFLAVLGVPAAAQTYYVDAVNGDDAHDGSSWDQAWRTISHAAATSGNSSTIEIAPGLYDASGGEAFPIGLGHRTFRGVAGAGATVVDGGGSATLFSGDSWYGGGILEGLTLRDGFRGVYVDVFCYMDWCTSSLTLREVVLTGMSDAAVWGLTWTDWFDARLDVVLERVVVEQSGYGVLLFAVCDPNHPTDPPVAFASLQCSDSLFRGNGTGIIGNGLDISNWVDLTIERCTFAGHTGTAIIAGIDAGAAVRSSILHGNGGDVAGAVSLSYSDTEHALHTGVGNLSEDPLFLDPASGDYRLRFGSPCVDAGAPTEPPGADLAGNVRPIDGDLDAHERADMGALELATLGLRGEPAIGTTVQLEFWGPPGGFSTLYWARGELTSSPVSTPFGEWDLDPLQERTVFATSATAPGPPVAFPLTIPNNPSYIGRSVSFQALSTSTVAFPPRALTNGVTLTIQP